MAALILYLDGYFGKGRWGDALVTLGKNDGEMHCRCCGGKALAGRRARSYTWPQVGTAAHALRGKRRRQKQNEYLWIVRMAAPYWKRRTALAFGVRGRLHWIFRGNV